MRLRKPTYNDRLRRLGIQPMSQQSAQHRSRTPSPRYTAPSTGGGSFKLWIMLVAVVFVVSAMVFASREGDEVKVQMTGTSNAQAIIEEINGRLGDSGVRLSLVESGADVNVAFKDDIGMAEADAYALTFAGSVSVSNTAPAEAIPHIVLHEVLHVAGVGHENDQNSVMHHYTQTSGTVKPEHIRALKRLPGITPPERIPAWISTWGGE